MNPNAVCVMQEAGVDISGQTSKLVGTLADVPLDLVITVCGHADENCPAFLGKTRVVHVGFDDPPKLARMAASENEAFGHCRRVRDEIRKFVETELSQSRIRLVVRAAPPSCALESAPYRRQDHVPAASGRRKVMMPFIEQATRMLFFTGKGGVGKTSLACAFAVGLADRAKRVLLVSTDPASNLGQRIQ